MTNYSLENLDQLHGFQIDAYLVALQGWQRSLQLKFHTRRPRDVYFAKDTIPNEFPGVVFTLSDGNTSHTFYRTRGDKTSTTAIDLCADKLLFKRHLESRNINTPTGEMFHIESIEDIVKYAGTAGYPLVLKPASGSMGRGVTANIKTKEELTSAIYTLQENFPEYKQVIVETYFHGEDYRVYVVGDKLVAAYTRDVARITGDGQSTVQALIDKTNTRRKSNPNTRNKLIRIDHDLMHHLKLQDVGLEDVIPNGQEIKLRSIPNISLGGNPKDVTSTLPLNIEESVITAVQSIDGLPNAGVDVLVNSEGEFTIIEMNSVAVVTSHVFPIEGDAIDVPAHIIDYYFPETTHKKRVSQTFDYGHVIESLAMGLYDSIAIKPVNHNIESCVNLSFQSTVGWISPKSVQAMLQMYDFHGEISREGNSYTLKITAEATLTMDKLIKRLKQRFLIKNVKLENALTSITHTGIHIKNDVPN